MEDSKGTLVNLEVRFLLRSAFASGLHEPGGVVREQVICPYHFPSLEIRENDKLVSSSPLVRSA